MDTNIPKEELSAGNAQRPWHAPALKALHISHTLSNMIPGTRYDGTYAISDGS